MLVDNPPVAADDECFGHAIDPQIDADAAIAINPGASIGVAELTKPLVRILRRILVGQAVNRDDTATRQLHQERMLDPAVSRYPLAWVPTYGRRMQVMFGGDPYPFGIDENRATWEQMLLYTYQQGIAKKHVTPEDIFPKGIMTKIVV